MKNKVIYYILLAILLQFVMPASAIAPEDVKYRAAEGRVNLVLDPDGLLAPGTRKAVEDSLTQLRLNTTAEVVVAVVPDLDGIDPQRWCERLFTRLKIGKEKEDNGLLIMISPGARQAFIMPGYGMEGVFTDIACKKLSEREIKPAMQRGDLDGAVSGVVGAVSKVLSDPEAAAEIRSDQAENYNDGMSALDPEVLWTFVRWLAAVMFLFSGVWFVVTSSRQRRQHTNYDKSIGWRKSLKVQLIFTLLSLGAGVVFFLLSLLMYRYWRTRKVKCPTCGSAMHRLPEDKDNELLSPSQDFEEKINTIDWDVWQCDECGTVERLPFHVPQSKYTECPACHTVAMTLTGDAVTRPATTRSEGEGVRIYTCKYCGHQDHRHYRIPRKEDGSALAAAAVLGAAASSRQRGGGGGFGGGGFGGFGGGATGGGGAGSSW